MTATPAAPATTLARRQAACAALTDADLARACRQRRACWDGLPGEREPGDRGWLAACEAEAALRGLNVWLFGLGEVA